MINKCIVDNPDYNTHGIVDSHYNWPHALSNYYWVMHSRYSVPVMIAQRRY